MNLWGKINRETSISCRRPMIRGWNSSHWQYWLSEAAGRDGVGTWICLRLNFWVGTRISYLTLIIWAAIILHFYPNKNRIILRLYRTSQELENIIYWKPSTFSESSSTLEFFMMDFALLKILETRLNFRCFPNIREV